MVVAEFPKTLKKKSGVGDGISERINVVSMAQALEKFFSKVHFFTALLQKGWAFPESCGGMGIGSEFRGIYLQELLLSLIWSALGIV